MDYTVAIDPKSLREVLCVAQGLMSKEVREGTITINTYRYRADIIQQLINECDRHRPLGPDGKHDKRHTETCGCEDADKARDGWKKPPIRISREMVGEVQPNMYEVIKSDRWF